MNLIASNTAEVVRNYAAGEWRGPSTDDTLPVVNPADGQVVGHVLMSSSSEVDDVVRVAEQAYQQWRRVPAGDRIQPLFKLKSLIEEHSERIVRCITTECGKTLAESRGELKRAIENIETACGIPTLMQGDFSQDVAGGIDEFVIRQPLGVCAAICPFNFPAMIPFWFLPYAVACGNTFIVKPSERVPMTMRLIFELIGQAGFPAGVVNLVNGGREVADTLLEHPQVKAISFVGSTPVARQVYAKAAAHGKRAQCQGGAKNPVVILPDCDMEMTTRIVADSAFGCAGQRCLAASLAITIGEARKPFMEAMTEAARSRVVGNGLDEQTQMGPVISSQSLERLNAAIDSADNGQTRLLADGRSPQLAGGENGNFLAPTLIDGLDAEHELVGCELFGPVLGLMHYESIDEVIADINRSEYGNMACVFTADGAAARKFRTEADAGNIGVNIGVAAPMSYFPFSGWKQSFFGDLRGQAKHAVEFFTQTKVVVERWPRSWSRQF